MKWHTITDFDSCLQYAGRLGIVKQFKSPGWIPQYQREICDLCDRIRNESGNKTWFHLEFVPFQIRYERAIGKFHFKPINTRI
jgi:hypothetical protein